MAKLDNDNGVFFSYDCKVQKWRALSPDFASPMVVKLKEGTVVFSTVHHYVTFHRFNDPEFQNRVLAAWTVTDLIFLESARYEKWLYDKHEIKLRDPNPAWVNIENQLELYLEATRWKFQQCDGLFKLLLSTEARPLYYAPKYDSRLNYNLGIGPDDNGYNDLGRELEKIRDKGLPGER